MSDRCRSCHAPITWAVTGKGRRMPLDPQPVAEGNIRLEPIPGRSTPLAIVMGKGEATTRSGYVSHFATCPNAKRHRKSERKAAG
jgi:hypothetical protein